MEGTKLVAFTFDDGPLWEYAEDSSSMCILRTLEQYGQRATCFYVGQQIHEGNLPELQYAQKVGIEVGNHSFTHNHLTECTAEEIKEEFDKTAAAIEDAIGKRPVIARIPYLEMNETIEKALDYPFVSCIVDSRDWAGVSTEVMIERIMEAEEKGDLVNSVVLMHEQYPATAKAVEYLIPVLMEKGYRFVTVSELAAQNGVTMKKHKVYGRIQQSVVSRTDPRSSV